MQIEYSNKVVLDHGWDRAAVRGTICGAHRVVLVAHTNADGDAVGSVAGMYHLLSKIEGLHVTPMLPDGVPDELAWLPGAKAILSGAADGDACREAIAAADLIIGLDISGLDRTGCLAESLRSAKAGRMLVDHHERPEDQQREFPLVVSEPDLSSTCELAYWMMRDVFGRDIFSTDAVTCLYTGLCTDTGTFSYSNHRPSLYLAAAEMLSFGIDPAEINRQIKNVFTEERLRFFGYAMAHRLEVHRQQQMALMVLSAKDISDGHVESHELTGLINEVMKLKDVDCAVLVREEQRPGEQEPSVRLSLRSKRKYDVNAIAAELFGGGGHKRAAGATSRLTLADTVAVIRRRFSLLAAALLLCGTLFCSCNNVPVVDIESPRGDTLSEHLINANRIHAKGEDNQIDNYVARRGWQVERLGGGARVMETVRGDAAVVSGDSVAIAYSVETLGGDIVYSHSTDTVVAGRIGRTHGYAPIGLDAALRTLHYGSKAVVILPSEQAYGVAGDGDRIGARTVLVYRIEVVRKAGPKE